jgi:uncharacterized integral membrane protein
MRFLVLTTIIALFVLLIIFMFTNPGVVEKIVFFGRTFVEVPLYAVVSLSLIVGITFTCVVAIAEGANTRLANRRLIRQIQKMETEINYLRTQPPAAGRIEPDELPEKQGAVLPSGARPNQRDSADPSTPSSAPVYGTPQSSHRDDDSDDDDDGHYTGGRAV